MILNTNAGSIGAKSVPGGVQVAIGDLLTHRASIVLTPRDVATLIEGLRAAVCAGKSSADPAQPASKATEATGAHL